MVKLNGSRRTPSRPDGVASPVPDDRPQASRPLSAQASKDGETYGRSCPPPSPGSSYWEFIHWASEGCMPFPEDTDLAITLWMGCVPEQEESSVPGLR